MYVCVCLCMCISVCVWGCACMCVGGVTLLGHEVKYDVKYLSFSQSWSKYMKDCAHSQPAFLLCSTFSRVCYCQKFPPPWKHSCLASPSLSTRDEHWLTLQLVWVCVDELTEQGCFLFVPPVS